MLAASYSKRDHVLALTEMQARETGGRFQKKGRNTKKGAVQQKQGRSRLVGVGGRGEGWGGAGRGREQGKQQWEH